MEIVMKIDTGNFGEVPLYGLRTVFRCAKKACEEETLRGDAVFDRKIEDFSIKNSVAPIDLFRGRLSSVARNSP